MKKLFFIVSIALLMSCQNKVELGKKNRIVEIQTEFGAIKIQLYDQTPEHRDNFVKLAHQHFFDGCLFHRVIDGFMIQGGDPDSKEAKPGQRLGEGGPGYQIPAEIHSELFHKKGVIAAAREGDDVNPEKKSAGSQFYLAQGKVYTHAELDSLLVKLNSKLKTQIFTHIQNDNAELLSKYQMDGEVDKLSNVIERIQFQVDSVYLKSKIVFSDEQVNAYTSIGGIPHLDGNYTVFGEVIEGLEIIDKIAKSETDDFDRPLNDIAMKIKILK